MTVRELLREGRELLSRSGISDTVDLDTSLLLCHVLGIGREKLFALLPDPVDEAGAEEFLKLTEQRCRNYPVAYLTGSKEFFGRDFTVGEGVLCPRPDTEILVEKSLEFLEGQDEPELLDLCSGSGCVGLTLALERPDSRVVCVDIDEAPEKAFYKNRESLEAKNASFTRSNLFRNVKGLFHLIATNPPYLTSDETSERMDEGWKEPALALDGGEDGLDLVEEIVKKSIDYLAPEGYLLIEAHPEQMTGILQMMGTAGFTSLGTADDLAGRKRVAYGRRKK
ncbi:MAG: peptide chain release factor N(5)-glutamine methyltransferase [Spirochaetales bacterium]|nr:peptide chain release factor N(5)-glutamine methyltransferase [Spirochaetales bacterium]